MTGVELIAAVGGVITILLFFAYLYKAIKYIHKRISYSNLAIAAKVIDQSQPARLGESRIKLAHSGNSDLLIERLQYTLILKVPTRRERILSWFQLSLGYLINDIDGLQSVLGFNFAKKEPSWLRKPINLFQGILMSLLVVFWLINPLGLLFILLFSPYADLELIADDDQIHVVESDTRNERTRPFLVETTIEREYLIKYNYLVKKGPRGWGRYFPHNIVAEYVDEVPHRHFWKLPRLEQSIWKGEELLFVTIKDRWRSYTVPMGTKLVRLLPPSD